MKAKLLNYICDPYTKSDLTLVDPVCNAAGDIMEGVLVADSGQRYPIREGIPLFKEQDEIARTVDSFGDEWNHFNFDNFKINWLTHTVRNTFGGLEFFKGKVVVDAGAGSGMQSLWMSQAGAEYVIALELSHSVFGVMRKNLAEVENVDIVQCSIDQPPLKDNVIQGMVICHNVIMHTPSVEKTAHALWRLVAKGGEFVFNCYPKNDKGVIRKIRLGLYTLLRGFLSKRSFTFILNYARIMSMFRLIPILGILLEKSFFMVRGDVPKGPDYFKRAYKSGVLNTYDCYGSHKYQHLKTDNEIKNLVAELQPDSSKVKNMETYFLRPQPIGCALRLIK